MIFPSGKRVGESKSGVLFGKATEYGNDGRISNSLWENNRRLMDKEITHQPERAFYRDGEVLCALDYDLKDCI